MDGRKVKAIRRIEGNKLVTEQYDQKTNKLQVRGEISVDSDGRMVEVLNKNDSLININIVYLILQSNLNVTMSRLLENTNAKFKES